MDLFREAMRTTSTRSGLTIAAISGAVKLKRAARRSGQRKFWLRSSEEDFDQESLFVRMKAPLQSLFGVGHQGITLFLRSELGIAPA